MIRYAGSSPWRLLLMSTDPLVRAAAARRPAPSPRRVLVVRTDGIGDFVLFTDALRGLREIYARPGWEIVLLGNAAWQDLVPAVPEVDRALFLDRGRFTASPGYRWGLVQRLRSEGFSAAINPQHSRQTAIDDSAVRASGATERIGWRGDLDNASPLARAAADRWYTRLIEPMAPGVMELDRNTSFVRSLGLPAFTPSLPRIVPLPAWRAAASELLSRLGAAGRFVAVVPGSGLPREKAWPAERWAGFIAGLLGRMDLGVVLVGGSAERGAAQGIVRSVGDRRVHDLTGLAGLDVLAGLLSMAALTAGNDTGAVHLAAAVGAPSLCIRGGGHGGRFFPYRIDGRLLPEGTPLSEGGPIPPVVLSGSACACPAWSCHRPFTRGTAFPCLLDVTVETALHEAERLLGRSRIV